MSLLKQHFVFIACLLLCSILRFLPLFEYQFTYDELSGLDRTQFGTLHDVLEKGVKIDAHPALVQLIIFYLSKFFGYLTWIIKLPFLLFGQAAIFYAYFFGRRNFSAQTGNIATILFSFSFIFVFYAPIARMYISGVFFSIALLYYFFEIFFQKSEKVMHFFFFGLFALLSGLNQHLNALFAFTLGVAGLFFMDKTNRKAFVVTCSLTVLTYLPHLSITFYQLSIPGIGRDAGGWLEAPDITVLFDFIRIMLGTGSIYLAFILLIVTAAILRKKFTLDKKQIFLLSIFLLNFLIIYLYSVFRAPVFQYSVMLFSATALAMLVSSLLEFADLRLHYVAALVLSTLLIYRTYFHKNYLGESVKTVYEYQFERTKHYKSLYGDTEVFPMFFDCDTLMRRIYFDKYQTTFEFKMSSDPEISYGERRFFGSGGEESLGNTDSLVSSVRLFSEFISKLRSHYLILSSASPVYQAIALEQFPYLLENTQTQGINFKLYSRLEADKINVVISNDTLYTASVGSPGDLVFSSNTLPLDISTNNEFPFSAKGAYEKMVQEEGNVILVRANLRLHAKQKNSLECCISAENKTDGKSLVYAGKSAGDFRMRQDSTILLYADQFAGTQHHHIKNKARLNCFLWNRGGHAFGIQTFDLKVINYWPQKWNLWR